MSNEGFTQQIIKYWVHKGYDSDELIMLGSKKSVAFLVQIAETWPEMDNEFLLIHIQAFIKILSRVHDKGQKLTRLRKISLR